MSSDGTLERRSALFRGPRPGSVAGRIKELRSNHKTLEKPVELDNNSLKLEIYALAAFLLEKLEPEILKVTEKHAGHLLWVHRNGEAARFVLQEEAAIKNLMERVPFDGFMRIKTSFYPLFATALQSWLSSHAKNTISQEVKPGLDRLAHLLKLGDHRFGSTRAFLSAGALTGATISGDIMGLAPGDFD